jgi:hypothetical protein
MMAEDWYRHDTWTEEDQAQFYAKYKRARKGFHRCQYAGIQALYLVVSKNRQLARAVLDLLDLAEQEDPLYFQRFQVTKADALDILGAVPEAVEAYRVAIKGELTAGATRVSSQTSFGFFVLRRKQKQHYQEALTAIIELADDFLMPIQAYNYHLLCALFNERLGHHLEAVGHAKLALEACEIAESAFRKHRKLGLASPNPEFHPELECLANSVGTQSAPVPTIWKNLLTLRRRNKGE